MGESFHVAERFGTVKVVLILCSERAASDPWHELKVR